MIKDVFDKESIEKLSENMSETQKITYVSTMYKLSTVDIDLTNKVWDCSYTKLGNKSVVCCMILNNGFEIIANATPINAEDYNFELGRVLSKYKAYEQLMQMEIYRKYVDTHDECIFEQTETEV